MSRPSPAAAAAVSRVLREAGISSQVELPGRLYSGGFAVDPMADHIQVCYYNALATAHDPFGLRRCEEALKDKYDVRRVEGDLYLPGGAVRAPVLEVRSERWGR